MAHFERIAMQAEARTYERRLLNDDQHGGLCLQACYCNLVVLSQTVISEASTSGLSDPPEYVVRNSGRPVLIIPHIGGIEVVGNRALVAWDGRMEATRAVAAAIPLLQGAKNRICKPFCVGKTNLA